MHLYNNYRQWSWPNCDLFNILSEFLISHQMWTWVAQHFQMHLKHFAQPLLISRLALFFFFMFSVSRAPCCSNWLQAVQHLGWGLNASQLSCHYSALYSILPLGSNFWKYSLAKKGRLMKHWFSCIRFTLCNMFSLLAKMFNIKTSCFESMFISGIIILAAKLQ